MGGGRLSGSALGLALCALLIGAAPASAGFKYAFTPMSMDPGGTYVNLPAECPSSTHVIGGGMFNAISNVVVSSSYPTDSAADSNTKPDDAWSASVHNLSANQNNAGVFAVCATQQPKYEDYAGSVLGETSTGEACPAGATATSGGLSTTSTTNGSADIFIRGLAPYDFVFDSPNQSTAVVKGDGVNEAPAPVFAVCSRKLDLAYELDQLTIGPNAWNQTFVKCHRDRHVVGGGGVQGTVGTGWDLRLNISQPSDGHDPDHKPDDWWRIAVSNFSSEQRSMPVVAVCAK